MSFVIARPAGPAAVGGVSAFATTQFSAHAASYAASEFATAIAAG